MSAADEDTELRDLLVQTLDKNGVLGKIKAELRASIFLALEAQEQDKTQNPLKNSDLQKFVATEDGRLCIGIINQFLDHFHLDYTTAVFGPEVSASEEIPQEDEINKSLNLIDTSRGDTASSPLLSRIVQEVKAGCPMTPGLQKHQIDFLKSKFHSFDHTSSGSIEKNDVATVISYACPQMNTSIIEKFITDELKNVSQSSVTFDSFLNLFQKIYDMCATVMSVGSQLPSHHSSDNKSSHESYYLKQNTPFHQVPASPAPMQEPPKSIPASDGGGIPSTYLMPTSSQANNNGTDVEYDPFLGSQPGEDPFDARARSGDAAFLHTDTPALSPTSSKASNDWPKKFKEDDLAGQEQYEDDFHTEQSISEDIQDMGDDLLQISEKDESLDLTEDRTVSEIPHADYMEDIRHG